MSDSKTHSKEEIISQGAKPKRHKSKAQLRFINTIVDNGME